MCAFATTTTTKYLQRTSRFSSGLSWKGDTLIGRPAEQPLSGSFRFHPKPLLGAAEKRGLGRGLVVCERFLVFSRSLARSLQWAKGRCSWLWPAHCGASPRGQFNVRPVGQRALLTCVCCAQGRQQLGAVFIVCRCPRQSCLEPLLAHPNRFRPRRAWPRITSVRRFGALPSWALQRELGGALMAFESDGPVRLRQLVGHLEQVGEHAHEAHLSEGTKVIECNSLECQPSEQANKRANATRARLCRFSH